MKVGLIRCMQTEDMCPASTCLKVMKEKKLAFEEISENIEVIGVNTCGGCPGKNPVQTSPEMDLKQARGRTGHDAPHP